MPLGKQEGVMGDQTGLNEGKMGKLDPPSCRRGGRVVGDQKSNFLSGPLPKNWWQSFCQRCPKWHFWSNFLEGKNFRLGAKERAKNRPTRPLRWGTPPGSVRTIDSVCSQCVGAGRVKRAGKSGCLASLGGRGGFRVIHQN